MKMVPSSRPAWPRNKVANILVERGVTDPVSLLLVRGYYQDTMGNPGVNDRAIYDDALFVTTPNGMMSFNANADPGVYRKGVANLAPGIYTYRIGLHGVSKPNPYEAFRQAGPVVVERDDTSGFRAGEVHSSYGVCLGKGRWTDKGWKGGYFWINGHKGGASTTSSLGCWTIHPSQFLACKDLVKSELKRCGQTSFPVLLIHQQG